MTNQEHQPTGNGSFLVFAAICAFMSAITTSILVSVDIPRSEDIFEQARLAHDTTYLFRTWAYFFHPLVALVSMIGVFLTQHRQNLGVAITALIFFIFWAFAEALQQALALDALNQYWRPMLLNAEDPSSQATAVHLITGFRGIYDSFYFLLLFAYGIGSLLMGLLLVRAPKLSRFLGVVMIYFGVLSLVSFFSIYTPWQLASGFVAWNYQWIYPFLQPLARALLAWFLLSQGLLLLRQRSDTQSPDSRASAHS